ncbi:Helicase superfamily 1/2, ATP-binding domain,DEAD/DEAH box helicase domain,P-loop containing [Cinara cedri]|uniref:Helicase superfamily 1/2, ATP-binding domain,DEAD/DEAH box helicase domain,P-loop containing n=1 Tax=Cinara cedri TaxID=506608 RepID=A0A5E4MXK1_9HEMI|nr:Helicase superfamily 1/2, ATP-binding domain,DEAD/DEAH box helicase domain,P-loop containing [Cinara cedri]
MDPQTEEVTDTIVCQDLLLGKGRVVNKILYLPSASKKINLIKMMIKKMGYSLNKSLGSERKWTFYIVETESLINKHIKDLRNHLPWNIGIFLSSINVFLYSQEQWKQILNKCHIVVMSASMYLSNLQTSVININDANLIIFDECHNALSSHPLNQIMKMFHDNDFKQSKSPFILGITSTLINTNVNDVKEHLNELQNTFNATIQTSYKGKMSM